jgi:AhpD family alkylhydroperoxidase
MQEHGKLTHALFDDDAFPDGELDESRGLADLGGATYRAGALDAKTRELIGVAVGVIVRCSGCIAMHTRAARNVGANRNEVLEAVGLALHMGGGGATEHGIEAVRIYDGLRAEDEPVEQMAG